MTNQDHSSIIEFMDLAEKNKAIAIVKVSGNGVGLALSLEHGSDTEVLMRHLDTKHLISLLQEALRENERQIVQKIDSLVKAELPNLPSHLREWTENHLIIPRQEVFAQREDGTGEITLWLVTDHASNRIVYDEVKESFGFVMDIRNNVKWFMGLYGGLAETIDAI